MPAFLDTFFFVMVHNSGTWRAKGAYGMKHIMEHGFVLITSLILALCLLVVPYPAPNLPACFSRLAAHVCSRSSGLVPPGIPKGGF
jgi:hypothetical protein